MTTQEGWAPPAHPVGPGWMAFLDDPGRPVVHFTRDHRGRWRVDAIYVAAATLDSDTLRRLSIPSFEARANDPTGRALLEQWASLAGERPPELWSGAGVVSAPAAVRRRSARLKVPDGAKPDSFYRKIADVYRRLAGVSNRPAVELAEANNVPLTTAHRWIREARRRGHLPPGQKGRRG